MEPEEPSTSLFDKFLEKLLQQIFGPRVPKLKYRHVLSSALFLWGAVFAYSYDAWAWVIRPYLAFAGFLVFAEILQRKRVKWAGTLATAALLLTLLYNTVFFLGPWILRTFPSATIAAKRGLARLDVNVTGRIEGADPCLTEVNAVVLSNIVETERTEAANIKAELGQLQEMRRQHRFGPEEARHEREILRHIQDLGRDRAAWLNATRVCGGLPTGANADAPKTSLTDNQTTGRSGDATIVAGIGNPTLSPSPTSSAVSTDTTLSERTSQSANLRAVTPDAAKGDESKAVADGESNDIQAHLTRCERSGSDVRCELQVINRGAPGTISLRHKALYFGATRAIDDNGIEYLADVTSIGTLEGNNSDSNLIPDVMVAGYLMFRNVTSTARAFAVVELRGNVVRTASGTSMASVVIVFRRITIEQATRPMLTSPEPVHPAQVMPLQSLPAPSPPVPAVPLPAPVTGSVPPLTADEIYNQGVILWNIGKLAEAKIQFEAYLALAPNGPNAKQAKALVAQAPKK